MLKRLADLPVGSKVLFGKYKALKATTATNIEWTVVDRYRNDTLANATTLVTTNIIDIMAFDAKETDSTTPDIAANGNSNYINSNIRQWLNSSDTAWYTQQHATDKPPTNALTGNIGNGYDTRPGFLNAFSTAELAMLLASNLTSARTTISGDVVTAQMTDRIFLLSADNLFKTSNQKVSTKESEFYKYFISENARCAKLNLDASKVFAILKENDVYPYWTRSQYGDVGSSSVTVYNPSNDTGIEKYTAKGMPAYKGVAGVRCGCNVKSDVLVEFNTDKNAYTVVSPKAASIYAQTSDIGDVKNDTVVKFKFILYSNTPQQVKVSIDSLSSIISSISVNPNKFMSYTIPQSTINNLDVGDHKIFLNANDGADIATIILHKVETIQGSPMSVSTIPMTKRNADGTYSMLLPINTTNEVYTDMANKITLKEELTSMKYQITPKWSTNVQNCGEIKTVAYAKNTLFFEHSVGGNIVTVDATLGTTLSIFNTSKVVTKIVAPQGGGMYYLVSGKDIIRYKYTNNIHDSIQTMSSPDGDITAITVMDSNLIYAGTSTSKILKMSFDDNTTSIISSVHTTGVIEVCSDGKHIYSIDGIAVYKLSLTGTPLKSDHAPTFFRQAFLTDNYINCNSGGVIVRYNKGDLSVTEPFIFPQESIYGNINNCIGYDDDYIIASTDKNFILLFGPREVPIDCTDVGEAISGMTRGDNSDIYVTTKTGRIIKYSIDKNYAWNKTFNIVNHHIDSYTGWEAVTLPDYGQVWKYTMVLPHVTESTNVDIDFADAASMYTANEIDMLPIVETSKSKCTIYACTKPQYRGDIVLNISVTN